MFSSFYDTIPLWRWYNKTMMKIIIMRSLLRRDDNQGSRDDKQGNRDDNSLIGITMKLTFNLLFVISWREDNH